ncbi:MAG TPA: hypothetical protein VFC96_03155, partial [Anaerovoracaceae bacterium]|nr:hypothetical protein [Anaerovoracaceae bacterium]
MTAIIFNSRAYKFAKSLAAGLVNAWNHSLLGRLNVFITLCYEKSLSKRIWLRFYSVENTVANSLYGALLKKARGFLFILGDVLRQSLFYRFIIFIRNVYFKATAGSIIFSLLHRLGLRQWLLLAFTLYLPLDYFFRTKVTIAIVASLWEELFIMAAALLILWRKALKQSGAIGRETPLDCYILLFMSVGLLLMSVVNPHPAIALAGYRATVEYMIWFFLIIRLIENEKDLKIIFGGILTVGILLGFHGIYQYIIGVPIPASWVTKTEMGVRTRVFSLTGSPNILGSLMVMIAPMSAALIYYCKKIVNKIFFTLTTGAMCLCLLFTFSRGAWVGMVVAVIIFALFIDKRLLGVMGAGLASALIFVPSITSRLTYLFTSDYAEASAVGGRT